MNFVNKALPFQNKITSMMNLYQDPVLVKKKLIINISKGINHNVKLFTNNKVDTAENLKKSALKAKKS